MSIFHTTSVPCPSCGTKVDFQLVHSINADRRRDLRAAIQEGTFQLEQCKSCGTSFRMDPQFNYLDIGNQDWIAVYPSDDLDRWREIEADVREVYDVAFGAQAPAPARALGRGLRPRLVFGWPALREKLAARDHGLDDVQLELFKIGLLRNQPGSPLGEETELRFLEVPADGSQELSLAWLDRRGNFLQGLRVPRELYESVGRDPAPWQDLREQLSEGLLVDMKRLIAVGA
jgi:CpXC motif protein